MKLGASLLLDGAFNMLPDASLGGSFALWFLSADRAALTTFGISAWPTNHRDPNEVLLYADYERPLWTFFVQGTNYLVDLDPVQLGISGGFYLALRRRDDGMDNELTIGISVGAAMRWTLSSLLALRFQVGVAGPLSDRKLPGVASLALDIAFN